MRDDGWSWSAIAQEYDTTRKKIARAYSAWRVYQANKPKAYVPDTNNAHVEGDPMTEYVDSVFDAEGENTALLTEDNIKRILSLDDLIAFFKVDTKKWQVRDFRINKWEQHSVQKGVVPLYQVRANLIANLGEQQRIAQETLQQVVEDMKAHTPVYAPVFFGPRYLSETEEPCLQVLSLRDPHVGMLAWGKETGAPYETDIATRDYGDAVDYLLRFGSLYNVQRILYPVGDDLMHVDGSAPGGTRGGATTAGTQQDIDSRLPRIFTAARRAVVAAIDKARLVAPVDVVIVPGNHDRQTMYKLGEVLQAWYRNDDRVTVRNDPRKRHFYGWPVDGPDLYANAFMMTHGEEYRRQRDSLPLIFATECPADLWVRAKSREIHTGHNHINLEGRYTPTSEANETRGIRTRSLPGLTPEDSWHTDEGYKHRRAATTLVYRATGGILGLHEYTP
jgi:hypothetical protein